MRLLSSLGNGGRLLSLGLVLSSLGLADTILFQRALPTGSNVNATSNRSNVDWINPTDTSNNFFINGDTFTVPNGQQWQISSIAVFIVLNKTNDTPGAEFSNFSLYFASDPGDDGDGNDLTDNDEAAQNFSVVSTTPTPTLQTISTASACNGNNIYLASDGVTCLPVYMMSFATSLTLPAGTYDFAANGTLAGGLTGCTGTCGWYNLATNAGLSGTTQNGADGLYLDWFAGTPTPTLADLNQGYITINSNGAARNGPCGSPVADQCGGFSSSTDMNVVVTGNQVPEPGTITMFALGGLAVALTQIRRRVRR